MVKLGRNLFWLLRQLLPPACSLCRTTLPEDWQHPFCVSCLTDFPPIPDAHCTCCALPFPARENSSHLCGRCNERQSPFSKVFALGCFESSLRKAVHQFKFNRQVSLDRPLAELLAKVVPADIEVDLLVPVPLHVNRLRQRSYNQSLLLARELGCLRKWPVCGDLLLKHAETATQQGLSAAERERNLRQVFRCQRSLLGENILLVDDVMTTGATARACSEVLLDAGAGQVWVAVVGRA